MSLICKFKFGELKLFSYFTILVTRNLSGDFYFVLHVSLWSMPCTVPLPNRKPAETIHWHGKSALWDFCLYGCIENVSYLGKGYWKSAHPFPGWIFICQVFWSIQTRCTSFSRSLQNELKLRKERHLRLSADTGFADVFYIHRPEIKFLPYNML